MNNAMNKLEAHWQVLEAETVEIQRDILHLEGCVMKYGDVFKPALQHLKILKEERKNSLKRIRSVMNKFSNDDNKLICLL